MGPDVRMEVPMNRWFATGLVAMALFGSSGCGAGGGGSIGSSTLRLEGSVAPGARVLDDARVAAVASDGRVYWAYLDARGAFAVEVPVGGAYRVLVANARASGGQRVIGHLTIQTAHGASRWMAAPVGGILPLGALRRPHAGPAATTKDLGGGDVASSDSSGSSSEPSSSDHDYDSHDDAHIGLCSEHDGAEVDDDVELEADDDPGDGFADEHESEHEAEAADDDDAKACPPPPAPGAPPAAPTGTPPAPTGTTSAPPPPPPPPPPPGTCVVNANCLGGGVCVAAKCVSPLR
jgi:hypothetical protein